MIIREKVFCIAKASQLLVYRLGGFLLAFRFAVGYHRVNKLLPRCFKIAFSRIYKRMYRVLVGVVALHSGFFFLAAVLTVIHLVDKLRNRLIEHTFGIAELNIFLLDLLVFRQPSVKLRFGSERHVVHLGKPFCQLFLNVLNGFFLCPALAHSLVDPLVRKLISFVAVAFNVGVEDLSVDI